MADDVIVDEAFINRAKDLVKFAEEGNKEQRQIFAGLCPFQNSNINVKIVLRGTETSASYLSFQIKSF